jgi:hypothetical protein
MITLSLPLRRLVVVLRIAFRISKAPARGANVGSQIDRNRRRPVVFDVCRVRAVWSEYVYRQHHHTHHASSALGVVRARSNR